MVKRSRSPDSIFGGTKFVLMTSEIPFDVGFRLVVIVYRANEADEVEKKDDDDECLVEERMDSSRKIQANRC